MQKFDTFNDRACTYIFLGEPLIYQSDYFNVLALKSVEEVGKSLDLKNILVTSAQEIANAQFKKLFHKNERLNLDQRKKVVEDYFMHCGYGKVSFKSIQPKGGYVTITSDLFANAWVKYFGLRDIEMPGVGCFILGFLCGAIEAMLEVAPGTFDGKQLKCIAKGDQISKFEIFRGLKRKLNGSPELGKPKVNIDQIPPHLLDLFESLTLTGAKDEKGLITAFDIHLTKQYVNYWALVSIKLLMIAPKKLGPNGLKQVRKMLEDLGEINAYHMVGHLVKSDYWKNQVAAKVGTDKTRLCQTLFKVISGLGYGRFDLESLNGSQLTVDIMNNPTTNAYLKLVGKTKAPLGYMTGGFLIGIANLLQVDFNQIKVVDDNFINKMKVSGKSFEYVEKESRMTGSANEIYVVSKT